MSPTTRLRLYDRLPLGLLLAVFVALKLPHLFYPYCWDESWSYAPGIRLMYLHGPTLMPGAIDHFYSRGHPLLFYAAVASWLDVFGDSHVARHAFALFVSCLMLGSLYECCLRLMNRQIAAVATALLAAQVIFFVQASYVLPEILVALLSFGAVGLFAARRYGRCAIVLTLLLQTKESGLVVALVLGWAAVLALFQSGRSWKNRLSPLMAVLVPGLLIGLFFWIQWKRVGWVFYPEHTALIDWNWSSFYDHLRFGLETVFYQDNRQFLFALLLLPMSYATFRKRQYGLGVLMLPAITTTLIITNRWGGGIADKIGFSLWVLTMAATAWVLYRYLNKERHNTLARMLALTVAVFVAYVCFCAVNFITVRYLLAALVIAVFWIGLVLWLARVQTPVQVLAYGLAVAIPICLAFRNNTGLGDVQLGSFNAMHVQQAVVDFLERGRYYNTPIGVGSFQDREHLTKPMTGFLKSDRIFTRIHPVVDSSVHLAIFNNIEPDYYYKATSEDSAFKLIFRYQEGEVWAEVFERKNR